MRCLSVCLSIFDACHKHSFCLCLCFSSLSIVSVCFCLFSRLYLLSVYLGLSVQAGLKNSTQMKSIKLRLFYTLPHVTMVEQREVEFADPWMRQMSSLARTLRKYFIRDLLPLIFGYCQISFTCVRCNRKDCTCGHRNLLDSPRQLTSICSPSFA